MSRKILINSLTDTELQKISIDLQIVPEPSKYALFAKPTPIFLFETDDEYLYVPFSYGKKYPRPNREDFPDAKINFKGVLRENQKEIYPEAISLLNKKGSVIISGYPGFGKTGLSIFIACRIKLRTLVFSHRVVLINQWRDAIKKFSPNAKVQILTPKAKLKDDTDFAIINVSNVCKFSRDFYTSFGCLIVDECHLIMASKLSACMRYITPRYLIGLSATPYRMDGLDVLLDNYFGTEKIIRKLYRKHTVYKLETGIQPEVKLNKMGKVDWNSVMESQCENRDRNETIIKIIKYFSSRVFLVLCKRVSQANYLVERLEEEKEDVTSLIGSNQTFEQSSRILIGIVGKVGVGFDHPRLDTLLLASDVEQYFIQYLGRVFRREDSEPVIIDLVDDYSLLKKHFRTRNAVYIEHGGAVRDFRGTFLDFPYKELQK